MKFNDFVSQYDVSNQILGNKEIKRLAAQAGLTPVRYVYRRLLASMHPANPIDLSGRMGDMGDWNRLRNSYILEQSWIEADRPYYSIWPGIIKPLLRVKLDRVFSRLVHLPLPELAFRLPAENNPLRVELVGGPYKGQSLAIRSLFVAERAPECDKHGRPWKTPCDHRALLINAQFNETSDVTNVCVIMNAMRLSNNGDTTVTQELATGDYQGSDLSPEAVQTVFKLVVGLCLLSRDVIDNLVMPDVLADDRHRWEESHDQKFVDKAHRRGKVGWDVGQALEEFQAKTRLQGEGKVSPHYRSPSPLALYYTGPGATIPILRYRRGTFVHEDQIRKMPTGFGSKEDD